MRPEEEPMTPRVLDPPHRPWMWLGVTVLTLVAVVALVALARARARLRELDASHAQTAAAFALAQNQIQALNAKLDALSDAEQAREVAAAQPAAAERTPRSPARRSTDEDDAATDELRRSRAIHGAFSPAVSPKPPEDSRATLVESQLAEQKQALAKTRNDLTKTQADLQGRIASTRDELNASIARTHEQVVNLQKRGERNYYEFQLDKSKDFQHVGPVSIALRKVNSKHDHFDLELQVKDVKLAKKHVNLYEPVWINLSDRPQPIELVVNQMRKNHVGGYLSEPKYRKSELASTAPVEPAAQLQKR
jgi:hypothetical protein